MQHTELSIKLIEPNKGQIVGLPKNPRFIKNEEFDLLVKSIESNLDFLKARDILVFPHNDKYVIIGGEMRYRACKELKIKDVPVCILPKETPIEKLIEYTIIDNTHRGEFDIEILNNEWSNVEFGEWGVSFTEEEITTQPIEEPINTTPEAVEDDYEVPEVEEIKTDIVLGDLFEIGEHRLICGDSTKREDVERLMNGEKADLVFTDPPYGVDYKGINNDNRSGLKKLLEEAFSNYILYSKNGASVYCFHSDKCSDIFNEVFRYYCHFSSMIIWVKESIVLSQTDYQSKHEPCFYGWFKNGSHKWYSDRKQESVWIAKSKREEGHTTPKPIGIVSKGINNSSLQNHLVLDLFLGSGSTMVASHQLKRKCYGMELDPKYCQVIVDRMRKLDPDLIIKKNGIVI